MFDGQPFWAANQDSVAAAEIEFGGVLYYIQMEKCTGLFCLQQRIKKI